MGHRKLPKIEVTGELSGIEWRVPDNVLALWSPEIKAAATSEKPTISIYGYVGETPDGSGMTDRKLAAILRSTNGADVTLAINSPGGNFLQGVAQYNQLRAYSGKVEVQILGIAGSAASVIAMAGDEIRIADAGFMFIHNSQGIAMGDRHALADLAETMAMFDASMAKVYAQRTGRPVAEFVALMDKEKMFDSKAALDIGLVDALLRSDEIERDEKARTPVNALREFEKGLGALGYTQPQRNEIIASFKEFILTARDAGGAGARDAAFVEALQSIRNPF